MAGIKGKDTKPELLIRKELYRRGYRYRLHVKDIKARPDIVLRRYNSLIFVNGCFWHGHDNCKLFRYPKSRTEFWESKISGNIERDQKKWKELAEYGWRILVVWECSIKNRKQHISTVVDLIEEWLLSNKSGICQLRLDPETNKELFFS